MTVTTGLIIAVLSGAATLIATITTIIRPIHELISDIHAIKSGLKSVHRYNMLDTYYRCADTKQIRQYALENFVAEYKAYKALGGNSFIDKLYEKVMDWETVQ